ncbi:MAG TPA: amidohydrolase family protein [Vicinamibacterales bacterium]|nr:amidohydrolase family protein [Vicinamibacterales bacterium]
MARRLPLRLLSLGALIVLISLAGTRMQGQSAAQTGAVQAAIVALRGGTVFTVTKGTIPNGTVVLRDGKIAAVGANIPIPSGAAIVDTTGQFVTPGLIDAHSHIANDAINEGGTTVSSMTGMEDVLDATDINIYRDLAGGLTTANVLHGSANPIGGKNQVIKLRWGKTRADDIKFEGAMPGIKFALGENPKDMPTGNAQTGPRRYPMTRMGVEFVIRDAFTRAKAYQKAWRDYEKTKATGGAVPPRRDLQLEPLVEILEGKRLVHAHCYRADEILMLIRLAEEMGFKIATFQHVLEGYMVAKEIAAHGAGASTFSDWWAYKVEAVDAIPYNAAIMTRKGVLVSINSDSAEHARRLNTEAAKTMKWGGLSEDEALALVTINPAKQLRIDSRVGSLEPGKDADVVIWNRHPLSTYAIAERVYIDGTVYYDRKGEEGRLTALKKEKATLAAAEQGAARPASSVPQQPQPPQKNGEGDAANLTERDALESGPRVRDEAAQATSTGAMSQVKPAGAETVVAITNATIHPITAPTIERGTIVLRGAKIEALGAGVAVPAGAKVVDAAGADVYPGFINARTQMGLNEPGPRGFEDVNEMLDVNPQLRTRVAYHSESDAIAVARTNGITTVAVMPGGGTFGGETAVMNLDGWTWEEATLKANAGITFNFPALGGGGGRGGRGGGGGAAEGNTYEEIKRTRDRRLDELARLFDRVRAYAKAGQDKTVDWTLEALIPVVERRLPLVTTVNRAQDIRDAVAFADRVNVKIVISGGTEANLVAPLLKEKNIPVILGNVLSLPANEDAFHAASYQLAGELAQAGVKVAFSTGDSAYVRIVPYHAAISVAWGMSRDDALKALTINAAEIFGVADRVGSLEPGKDANLFIAKGDPLEIRTAVTNVFINGKDVGLDNKHERLYQKYIARP